MKTLTIEEAVTSLHEIRRVIDRVQKPVKGPGGLAVRLIIQMVAALAAGWYFVIEWLTGAVTMAFMVSRLSPDYRVMGLTSMGLGIFLMVATLFCILDIGAKRSGEATQEYIARHFAQLSLLSFSSDLIVKFVALSGVILALRPDFVAPLLLIFTADYLLQGRVFTLPFRFELVAGLACVGIAVLQFLNNDASLLPALSVFTALALLSAWFTCRAMSRAKRNNVSAASVNE